MSEKLRAFISYAHEDSAIAGELKRGLKEYGIQSFLAHEDIEPTEEWRETILEHLESCKVFLPLLTDAGVASLWVQQECGIAAFRRMLIVPLKVTQDPKGFLAKYQAFKMSARVTESTFDKLVPLICRKAKIPTYPVPFLIKRLEDAGSFDSAAEIAAQLEDLGAFTSDHAEALLDAAVSNSQVYDSFKAAPIVRRIMQPYRKDVPAEKWKKFEHRV